MAQLNQRLPEDRQVVIVAQEVGEPVGLLGLSPYRRATHRRQEPQLIPEVLGPLAPLVQMLGVGFGPDAAQSLAALPIGSHQAGTDCVPTARFQSPPADPRPRRR